MRVELLEFLVCPRCQNDLNLLPEYTGSEEDVIEGELECKNCSQIFLIENGIPNLLLDDFD